MMRTEEKGMLLDANAPAVITYEVQDHFTRRWHYESTERPDNVTCAFEWANNTIAKSAQGVRAIIESVDDNDNRYTCTITH